MNNPYGAVPEALKETRLTLRDLMGDFLQTKILESQMKLAETKANTETAVIHAGIEKDRLASEREISRMKMTREMHDEDAARQADQFQQTHSLAQAAEARQALSAAQQADVAKGQLEVAQGQLGVAQGHLQVAKDAEKRAAAEASRKNEVRTVGEWVAAAGMNKGLLDFLGVDPNRKITRSDAENVYATLQNTFKSNPAIGVMVHGYTLRDDLLGIQKQLKDPKLTPQQAAALQKTYDQKMAQFENLDQLIMADKQPDQAKIVAAARQTYTDNPELQAKFPDFDKFLSAFQKDVTSARGVFQDDIKRLKSGSQAPGKATPQDVAEMKALSADFSKGTETWQKEAWKQAQSYVNAGKPDVALKYLRTMKQTLGAQGTQPAGQGKKLSLAEVGALQRQGAVQLTGR